MIEGILLNRLKAKQAEYSIAALKMPGDKTEFGYGKHVGAVFGLELAIQELEAMVAESKGDRDPL